MKTLLALDSFKGSLTACEAVTAAAAALDGREAVRLPLSDGGEGFTECLVHALGGIYRTIPSHDPLGRRIHVRYGLVRDGRVAVIETAAAAGLTLLSTTELDPLNASSFGIGEMVLDAVNQNVNEIWIGLGGTAVMDGGVGMLKALGPLPDTVRIHAFFDVSVPLTGPQGAAFVFGPQKGADREMVQRLDERFKALAREWKTQYGQEADEVPGAGAAGGIGAALGICLGAEMHSGIEAVLNAVGFRDKLEGCSLVITGEGKTDRQTLTGKVPFGVLQQVRSIAPDIPVVLVAGRVEDRDALVAAGFAQVIQMTPDDEAHPMDKEVASSYLQSAVSRIAQHFQDFGNQH